MFYSLNEKAKWLTKCFNDRRFLSCDPKHDFKRPAKFWGKIEIETYIIQLNQSKI